MAGERVRWFRREAYAGANSSGDVPRWHLPAYGYVTGEVYLTWAALCGYKLEGLRTDVKVSKAAAPRGPRCFKCEGRARR